MGNEGLYITNFCLIYEIKEEEKDFFFGWGGCGKCGLLGRGLGKGGILVINICLISRGRKREYRVGEEGFFFFRSGLWIVKGY